MDSSENVKSLQDIIKEGYNWNNGLCTILVDLCKRVKELEDLNKN